MDAGTETQKAGPDGRTGTGLAWAMRPAELSDVEAVAELRAVVMRPDLERLGRYDAHRVRQRLRRKWSNRATPTPDPGHPPARTLHLQPAPPTAEPPLAHPTSVSRPGRSAGAGDGERATESAGDGIVIRPA